ncbi:MAG: SGNH/GDSL hydrolase family protein [Bacteroidales bacterium]|nr:SGNH/GDSL hydrolase family protein [Bacteroidales bacterium]
MKRFKLLCALFLAISTSVSWAQENPYSQDVAEKNALEKYELVNPPRLQMPMPAPAPNEAVFGARISRSATLLATSNKDLRWPVKVLIYGQSITGSTIFYEQISSYLKFKFPFADVAVENRSIGGFGGENLVRTAVHDVYLTSPDLIIFHVYGGENHGELEQLFTGIRKYTTADVILMNHHFSATQKEYNPTSYNYLRYLANKYNLELVDISAEWSRYLTNNNLKAPDLLRDGVHPNRSGNWLLGQLIGRHIRYNSLFPCEWQNMVKTCFTQSAYDVNATNSLSFPGKPWNIINDVPSGESEKNPIKLNFYGNRVDIIAGQIQGRVKKGETPVVIKTGSARILIDGKPVADNNVVYSITRPSAGYKTWFPGVRRISYNTPLIPEDWTLKIDKVNADSTVWSFSVTGSKTGYDGSGSSDQAFVSKSGRVVIDPSDYMFLKIKTTFKAATPVGFEVKWSAVPLYKATYQSPEITDKTKVYKTTVVQGLVNGPHTLELIPVGDGAVPVEAFEIHQPPMQ